ncbi:formamidopyrimidine-DNA glycosylase [Trichophyton rubrum D6]|uniref:Formamidopyrimidine-DNA glycosylase n=3 Tax=Trichophyton TaxID=5550 RepID=F2SXL3_TRIRC|nr:formamidopyrimidine-DNA glycosylase [Trichophyton rubrum CBS 118892]EZF26136.1 formamidopyrimidine-DNA glycosylase [Trichophyton rubrum MR850]EZF45144.1 formamidopyrimidine-DNA glycosylase [Trichophyton rubrum CBS 100081]EZF55777.1 formamidopyrimidine-DNA glycosylase [Trichophyton rubrum CBS 288.86]EZF66392.1 formamidopyrimidine-DNA glycosylase [Trichophyton rubrum CBS 289.86]EZF77033.1 formamidopyrimidine-DNA glycosylase [Trichophyton soudanense CBS 452.61]EZF87686.1 formamidopyrimidine-D
MPELAEVSRIVNYIKKHLVGHTIAKVVANHDDLLFGKVGTSADEFKKHMHGKTVIGAGQQGKYFWMIMSSPPHPVMHFGMTGWLKIRSENTYYRSNGKDENVEADVWPPKFWKFLLETDNEPKTEAAFVDARRLGRVRLVDCPGDEIRKYTPLKENGPDPVIDKAILTEDWLKALVRRKKVPIKALLLDQANISGLGNWMGDEILYHARIHPEQYSDTLRDNQIKELHSSINYVCSVSVDLKGESSDFPTDWLFHHRWNKGKKGAAGKLPSGEPIVFVTVGGRTSAVVPSVQKKGGEEEEEETDTKPKKAIGKAKATPKVKAEEKDDASASTPATPSKKRKQPAAKAVKEEDSAATPASKKSRATRVKAEPEAPKVPLRRGRSAAKN